jgi:hypothetical protein
VNTAGLLMCTLSNMLRKPFRAFNVTSKQFEYTEIRRQLHAARPAEQREAYL